MHWGRFGCRAMLLLVWAMAASLVLPAPTADSALVLAKSRLETCTRDGSPEPVAEGVKCRQKLVVTLSMEAGIAGTETFEVVMDQAEDATNGEKLVMRHPLALVFQKNRPLVLYPIEYRASVNNRPFEIAVPVDQYFDGIFGGGCKDGWKESATCGFALDSAGEKIWDSQGFCCSCSIGEQILGDGDYSRAALDCAFLGGSQASAHCLRMFCVAPN